MGTYDQRANFEYVTALTGYPKIAYIGHSQGTSLMFYALATDERYFKRKLSVFIAMGPVTKIPHIQDKIAVTASTNQYNTVSGLAKKFDLKAIGFHNPTELQREA